jgi:hypothetical protein
MGRFTGKDEAGGAPYASADLTAHARRKLDAGFSGRRITQRR